MTEQQAQLLRDLLALQKAGYINARRLDDQHHTIVDGVVTKKGEQAVADLAVEV